MSTSGAYNTPQRSRRSRPGAHHESSQQPSAAGDRDQEGASSAGERVSPEVGIGSTSTPCAPGAQKNPRARSNFSVRQLCEVAAVAAPVRALFALLLFGAVCGVTYLAVVQVAARLVQPDLPAVVDSTAETESEGIFRDAVSVSSAGAGVRVEHDERLNPSADDDQLYFLWFKLRKSIADGDRMALLGKFDVSAKVRPGYALTLVGGPDGVHPEVYWQDEVGGGKWYPFTTTPIRAKEWYLLAVSFRAGRYLGMHLMPYERVRGGAKRAQLLGGYDLQPPVVAQSRVDLVVGAYGVSRFRGRIGPFGVLRSPSLSEDLAGLITRVARSPGRIPDDLGQVQVALWATPVSDIGPHRLRIKRLTGEPEGDEQRS